MLGTQREYADHLGCKEPYVSKLKREGKLVLVSTAEGQRVDFEASDALVAASRDSAKQGVRDRWARERTGHHTGAEAVPRSSTAVAREDAGGAGMLAGQPVGGGSSEMPEDPQERASRELYEQRLRAQIRTEQARAQVQELELLERAGMLMRAGDVEDSMSRYGRELHQAVLLTLIPHIEELIAPYVPEGDIQGLRTGMERHAKDVLSELADRVSAAGRAGAETRTALAA